MKRVIALSVLGAATLTACGSTREAGRGASALPAWRVAVACARAHGMPNLPDPILSIHGNVILPGVPAGTVPPGTVLSACSAQLRAINYRPPAPPTGANAHIGALVRIADCMRTHGYPSWPDPDPRGQFHVRSADAGTPIRLQRATSACKSLFPTGGWRLEITPSGY